MSTLTPPVLRYNQLDAQKLDNDIFVILKRLIKEALQSNVDWLLENYDPEIDACIKTILWKVSVDRIDASVGQKLLKNKYQSSAGEPLTPAQKKWHLFLVVLLQWGFKRLEKAMKWFSDRGGITATKQMIPLLFKYTHVVLETCSLVNFCAFLLRGAHVSLVDRVLDIKHVFRDQPRIRKVSYEWMNQDLLWANGTEFILYCATAYNSAAVQSLLPSFITSFTRPHHPPGGSSNKKSMSTNTCPLCDQTQCNSVEFDCGHAYCYYCLQTCSHGGGFTSNNFNRACLMCK